jgi:hypothetical protein
MKHPLQRILRVPQDVVPPRKGSVQVPGAFQNHILLTLFQRESNRMSSMSSSPIVAIATLNNNGVSCFQLGDLDASLGLFRRGLEAVATLLLPDDLEADRCSTSSDASDLTPGEKDEDRLAEASSSASSTTPKRSRDASLLLVASNPSEGAGSITQVSNAYARPIHLIPHEGSYYFNHTALGVFEREPRDI